MKRPQIPRLGPATTRVVEVMTKAIKVELGDYYDESRHGRMAAARVCSAFEAYERGRLYGFAPSTKPTKRAQEWRKAWEDLESQLSQVVDQIALIEEMLPKENLETGFLDCEYPEIRDGLTKHPSLFRYFALNNAKKAILPAHESVKSAFSNIPEPPKGKSNRLKPLKIRGYAQARKYLAPIRTGEVQLRGVRKTIGKVGDRVLDTEIARAMLEKPPLGFQGKAICVELSKKVLHSDDEKLGLEDAAKKLAKHLTDTLKP